MNYDFKANWNDVILPLLSLPKVKKSVKNGIISYIKDGNCFEDTFYNTEKCPAFYERGDGWAVYIDEYEEKLTEKLLETGILKKDENEPLDKDKMDEYFDTPNYDKYLNIIKKNKHLNDDVVACQIYSLSVRLDYNGLEINLIALKSSLF